MRRTVTLLFGVLAGLPLIASADPGNVTSWSSNSLNELTFTCSNAVVKLDFLDPNVVRVRMEPSGTAFNTNASFTVVKNWVLPPITVVAGSNLTVTTSGLQVNISMTPFRLTFVQTNGTLWLTDTNTTGLTSTPSGSITNLSDTFAQQANEQFYGLGLVLGEPLSYRGQSRTLYNARRSFEDGDMTDMAVPLMLSSKGYAVFVDNTFSQTWNFSLSGDTQWSTVVSSGELNYYFIGSTNAADALNRYTQITGTAPMPPRWTLGYMQSRYGYTNWLDMTTAEAEFRTNDLPCDALILDLYWYGTPSVMGGLTWDTTTFPNPSSNLAAFASSGIKVMNIQEEYINNVNQPALSNFNAAAAAGYLVSTNPQMTIPSIQVNEGFYNTAGYVDYSNPSARAWWWGLIQPLYEAGIAAFWTDLGEPEEDTTTDYLYGGHRESEIHNVYNLLWHQALAEGFASNYPNARLYILSRSGFAGDQRFGAGHWTNDTSPNWPTLAAHPTALGNYGLSGLSYFGSDIGGFNTPQPTDELYVRWFQFGSFCPIFRAHGIDTKPTAPYQFDLFVQDHCRNAMKLRYRLLPYVYTAARETFDTGMPMCRALPLAFPNDTNVLQNGNQFMFGSNIMVSPVVTQGAASQPTYLPAGNWIDLWGGQPLTGPVTTNWPAQIGYTPAFYRDNSITALGPYVESSQFDDGSQRGVRVYCSTNASFTLYDDDGASNGYRSNQFATTFITAATASNGVTVNIGGASGSYTGQPTQRSWQVELYCTNAVSSVIADTVSLSSYTSAENLVAAGSGYYVDGAEHLLRMAIPAASITQSHVISASLNLTSPPPYEARINAGGRPYLDEGGAMWVEDRPYNVGSFGIDGGNSNMVSVAIANTSDPVMFQSQHFGSTFSALFDCPDGIYESSLYYAETVWYAPGQRLFNVSIQGNQVLTNYDIFVAAGGSNTATIVTFTNIVLNGQLQIDFTGVTTMWDSNACVSAIRARKIGDLSTDTDGDGIPDWWRLEYFGHVTGQTNDHSMAYQDADGTGQNNLFKYVAGLNPTNPASVFNLQIAGVTNQLSSYNLIFSPLTLGRTYTAQFTTDLVTGVWLPLTTCTGPFTNGTQVMITDTNPIPPHEFYRIDISLGATQAMTGCDFALVSDTAGFGPAGGTGSLTLITDLSPCAWTATNNAVEWISITSSASGTGNETVNYSVASNDANCISRTGTMTIAGQTFTVTQAAGGGSYSIEPTSASYGLGGGISNISVTAGNGCDWTATSSAGWISITSGGTGTGSGIVTYSVATNATTSIRSGTVTIAGQVFAVTQTGELLAYWTLDEGTGSFAYDSSGNSNTGTVVIGGGHWTNGMVNGCLFFDGTLGTPSQVTQVTVSNSASLNPVNGITLAGWVNDASGGWYNTPRIIEKGESDNQYALFVNSSGSLEFLVAGVTNLTVNPPSSGAWHHLAATYDGSSSMSLYVDGQLAAQQVASGSMPVTTDPLAIGNKPGGTSLPNFFTGDIDDVRIYGTALAPAQISALYNIDSIGDGIANWWRLLYFGSSSTTNHTSCATCDTDGTGQNNLFKFIADLSPLDSTIFQVQIAAVASNQSIDLTFWPAYPNSNLTYAVQSSRDLVNYSSITNPGPTQVNGTTNTIPDLSPWPSNEFYRIQITNPNALP